MELKKQAKERLAASYNLHYNSLYRFCNARLKNEHQAEDCVQESFLVLYKKYMQKEQIENEKLFLYKVADNLIKAQWRKNAKTEKLLDIDSVAEKLAVESEVYKNLDFEELSNRLSSVLNENELLVYRLKYVEDKTIKEISEETALSFEAVAKRLSRLRQKLKEEFLEDYKG